MVFCCSCVPGALLCHLRSCVTVGYFWSSTLLLSTYRYLLHMFSCTFLCAGDTYITKRPKGAVGIRMARQIHPSSVPNPVQATGCAHLVTIFGCVTLLCSLGDSVWLCHVAWRFIVVCPRVWRLFSVVFGVLVEWVWDFGVAGDSPCHFAHFPVFRFCVRRLMLPIFHVFRGWSSAGCESRTLFFVTSNPVLLLDVSGVQPSSSFPHILASVDMFSVRSFALRNIYHKTTEESAVGTQEKGCAHFVTIFWLCHVTYVAGTIVAGTSFSFVLCVASVLCFVWSAGRVASAFRIRWRLSLLFCTFSGFPVLC